MILVVEGGIPEILHFIEGRTDKDQRRPGDFRIQHLAPDCRQRAIEKMLIRPADPVGNHHRAIRTVIGGQHAFNFTQVADRQVNGQGCPGAGEIFQLFPLWHGGGFHGGSGQDDALRDLGDGQLNPHFGGGGGIGWHPGDNAVINIHVAEPPDLLGNRAIERWVP